MVVITMKIIMKIVTATIVVALMNKETRVVRCAVVSCIKEVIDLRWNGTIKENSCWDVGWNGAQLGWYIGVGITCRIVVEMVEKVLIIPLTVWAG